MIKKNDEIWAGCINCVNWDSHIILDSYFERNAVGVGIDIKLLVECPNCKKIMTIKYVQVATERIKKDDGYDMSNYIKEMEQKG